MHRIESLLREKIGLDASSVGSSAIERTVRLRMKALGLKETDDYLDLIATSRNEWEELVESVVVTETWFFRDRDPFNALIELVRAEWLERQSVAPLRLLSLPCSSGEEPYSLAMALFDAGLPPERFTIDAADISTRALTRAKRGVYGKNSFRGKDIEFRDRYFKSSKDGHTLDQRVRDCVQFQRANLFEDSFLVGRAPYDFIFCRNLLIYFDRMTQAKALEKLHRLLTPQGVLFVGPAELPLALGKGFVSANLPMAFACRKETAVASSPTTLTRRTIRSAKSIPTPPVQKPLLPEPPTNRSAPAPTQIRPQPDLAAARQLADAGKLSEAAEICQVHLDRQGPSAQAFYLLGLVRDAAGDSAAVDYYRKALYLEPNHYETLLQMSLLLEKNGDTTGARTFKRRAERVRQKS